MKSQDRVSLVPKECRVCGCPESDSMKKRFRDFVVPLCDPCSYLEQHSGHVPEMKVRIDHVVVAREEVESPDGNVRVRMTEKRDTKHIRYADWDARCRACVP